MLKRRISSLVLALLLAAAGVAWWKTAPPTAKAARQRAAALAAAGLVDQSTYATAQRLALLAETPDEQAYAQSALRIADHALAFAFTTALRDAEAHPPVLSPEAQKIQDRIRKSQGLLDSDQERVSALTAALARAKEAQKDALQDQLDLAQSQLDLDKDELDGANQDLVDAGGNIKKEIETLEQEHDAQVKARAVPPAAAPAAAEKRGSWGRFLGWLHLKQKQQAIDDAQSSAVRKEEKLTVRRAALAVSLENAKGSIAELAQHAKSAAAGAAAPAPRSQYTHEDAATLLNQTKQIAANQKVLTLLDRRIGDQKQLAGIYGQWSALLTLQSHTLAHALLLNVLIVIGVLIVMLILDGWTQHLLTNPKLDRRQVETLRSIARIALRVVAVIIILLIVIGVPTQFGTMIGIVGAGLTVALKDFIVAFFGWLDADGPQRHPSRRLGGDQRRQRRSHGARHVPHRADGNRQLERCRTPHGPAGDVHQ